MHEQLDQAQGQIQAAVTRESSLFEQQNLKIKQLKATVLVCTVLLEILEIIQPCLFGSLFLFLYAITFKLRLHFMYFESYFQKSLHC